MNSSLVSCSGQEQSRSACIERLDWLTLLIGASLLLFLNAGCGGSEGPQRIAVAGTVTLDGTPMSFGLIRFNPKDDISGPGAMAQIVGGEFMFNTENGPVVGNHRIEIEATDFQSFEIDDETAFALQMQTTGMSPLANNPVPAIYNTASTLTATVTESDDQKFPFDLKSVH